MNGLVPVWAAVDFGAVGVGWLIWFVSMLIVDPEEFLNIRMMESDVKIMSSEEIPIRIQYCGFRPEIFVSHPDVVGSSCSVLLINAVSFSAEFASSWFSL